MNRTLKINLFPLLEFSALQRGAIFGAILLVALIAFEVFNFSTTAFALHDVLGDLQFAGVRWSTILAIAFCGIDFAGIARIFTPEQGRDEPVEVWYLFGAWLLAAAFNAALTWWGVSIAILNHSSSGTLLVGQATMQRVIPVMVAIMVWLVRVLIIGTFAVAGERLFTLAQKEVNTRTGEQPRPAVRPSVPAQPVPRPVTPAPKPTPTSMPVGSPIAARGEPTYHPISAGAMERRP
uniref:Uncharacterized protein n=1 Tax=uncultured Chloroflexota bacterium TaxID=166587 RepID=H5SA57_9CHLR|nr:hypothetical protein HGMM_F04B01C18 [uncultured Chloroflexota bacterium]